MYNSLWLHGLYSPWNSPGQNTGVGSLFPSPGDLPDLGIKWGSPVLQADSLPTELSGKPNILLITFYSNITACYNFSLNYWARFSYRHSSFYYTLQILHFLQIEYLLQLDIVKSVSTSFPTAYTHFMSLWHILVILKIFQTFSLLYFWGGLW